MSDALTANLRGARLRQVETLEELEKRAEAAGALAFQEAHARFVSDCKRDYYPDMPTAEARFDRWALYEEISEEDWDRIKTWFVTGWNEERDGM